MCGIAGMIDIGGGSPPDAEILDRMVDALYLRGPDDRGTSIRSPVAMGIRRLSIIDIEGGHQPIENEDGTVRVVQNGEIYSYPELREELLEKGHKFKTHADTEVLVHGYEEWGIDRLLSRLNGMFAFALQDDRDECCYLVRDRLGIKPLLYTVRSGVLFFGSSLSAILASGEVPVEPDPIGVRLYLHNQFIPGTFTAIKGVKKLAPASYLKVDRNRITGPTRYWSLPEEITEHRSFEDWAGELRELVTDAVRVHLVSDVEVGVFLSGGIDSSSTLGLMSRFAQRPVKAFSIGFERNTGFDETPFAETAAERFGAELFHTYFTASHVFDLARDVVRHLEEPLGDPACLPTYLLAQHARRHVKVVLSGEGADELFAGYGYYQRLGSMGNRLKGALRDLGSRLSRTGRQGHNGGLRLPKRFKDRSPLSGYPYAFSPSAVEYLLPDLPAGFMKDIGATTSNFERSLLPRAPHADALAKALHVDSQCFLPDDLLIKVDRMTMGHSLEARVPFLDYRVVELAMRMPSDAKLRNGRDKAVLRAAFGDLIGPVIANRQKHGFNLPMGEWITNELEPLVTDGLRIENLSACPWLSETGVRAVLDAHAEGRSSFERQIWMLYVLTAWFRDAQNQGPVRS